MKKILFAALVVAAFQGCDYTQLQEVYNPNSCPGDTTYLTTTVLNNETGAPFPNTRIEVMGREIVCFWGCTYLMESDTTSTDGTSTITFEHDTSSNVYHYAYVKSPDESFGPPFIKLNLDKGCANDFTVPFYRMNTVNAYVINSTTDTIRLLNILSKVNNLNSFSELSEEYLSSIYLNDGIAPSAVKLFRLKGIPNQKLTITANFYQPHGTIHRVITSSADTAITVNFLIK